MRGPAYSTLLKKKKKKKFKIIILDKKDSFTKKELFLYVWKNFIQTRLNGFQEVKVA